MQGKGSACVFVLMFVFISVRPIWKKVMYSACERMMAGGGCGVSEKRSDRGDVRKMSVGSGSVRSE